MTVLHTWAIAGGAAAVALPLIIHWLTRPRPKRMPLSTVRFVREVVQQRRTSQRLRDLIILACRVAAVLLLAWAFARPFIGASHPSAGAESSDAIRIVVLDTSQSMGATLRGVQLFEEARGAAAGHLSYSPGLSANLIFGSAQPRAVFERASGNFGAMRDELNKAQPLPQQLNVEATINLAADMLARSAGPSARRELIIISDFQRSSWSAADFQGLPKNTAIKFESVAPRELIENVGVLRVSTQKRVAQDREFLLEVEIGNYSSAARQVQVDVSIGDATWRLEGACAKGVKSTLSKELMLRSAGWQPGLAKLVEIDDALASDNQRPFVIEVSPSPKFALITRLPARLPPNSSHYLERALSPTKTPHSADRIVRIDPQNIDQLALGSAELIVLNRPGRLSQGSIELLVSLLRRGRGLLYVASDAADAGNLKLLAEAAGPSLKLPVEFLPPDAAQARRELVLMDVKRDQPPFSVFGGDVPAISALKFAGMLASRPVSGGLKEEISASYSDQTAALVISRCVNGNIAVLNADLAQSDLAGSVAFVPLVGEIVDLLVGSRRSEEALVCGERAAIELPPDAGLAGDLVIESSVETESTGQLVDQRGAVLWMWNSAGQPGVYQIKRKSAAGAGAIHALATAPPAGESELSYLDASVLTGRLAGGRSASYAAVGDQQQDKDFAWSWLLMGCAAVMLLEIITLRVFRT